ncbi:MAG: hypothetical protein ACRETD_04555, partial [Steroidobacteraceae bacterium]
PRAPIPALHHLLTSGTGAIRTRVAAIQLVAAILCLCSLAGCVSLTRVAPVHEKSSSGSNPVEPSVDCASPESANGGAPYCRSPVIASLSWDWNAGYHEGNGSDLWPVTWGRDGNVYAAFGDGGGFGGDDYRGRASFGIAMIAGTPPPNGATAHNVYGGYGSPHPARIAGKAGSIIAVGASLYGIGRMYTTAEAALHPESLSGSPNRVQITYSKGNAYSWRTAPWTFCQADATGQAGLSGTFCPISFINYGPGNSGAPDGQIYILGFANSTAYWSDAPGPVPAQTYLAKVPQHRLLSHAAYRYFAGLDAREQPVWSPDPRRMRPIFTDRNANRPGCGGMCRIASPLAEAVYDAGLARYIGIAQGDFIGQTSFYDASAPWGPWRVIEYNTIDAATGTGGWGNLGTQAGVSLGVHPVNAWASADGLTLWLTYSSDGKAPAGASFPPAGTALDSFNLVRVHLNLVTPER